MIDLRQSKFLQRNLTFILYKTLCYGWHLGDVGGGRVGRGGVGVGVGGIVCLHTDLVFSTLTAVIENTS